MKWPRQWKTRILLLFAVIGPGFITANVDNDAGGNYTYSSAGAHFGYQLLWSIIPITLALIVVQEMSARMGAVTGKGLSDLIREEYGLRITFLMMAALVVVNFSNVIAEFLVESRFNPQSFAHCIGGRKRQDGCCKQGRIKQPCSKQN